MSSGGHLRIVTIMLASMLIGICGYLVITYILDDHLSGSDRATAILVASGLSLGISIFIVIAAWIENKTCLMIAFICAIVMAVVWFVFAVIAMINDWGTEEILAYVVLGLISTALAIILFFTGFKK